MLAPQSVVADRYIVQGLLAQGGTADIYAVYDISLKVQRALKVAARPSQELAARWLKVEHEFLTRARSPYFPGCFEYLPTPAALVLEFCAGQPLDGLELDAHPTVLVAVLSRTWPLLESVHELAHVYRDLKPANVIVPDDVTAPWKLIDFGTVCPGGIEAEPVGTEGFAAPESLVGGQPTSASDVYSLGRCLTWLRERASVQASPLLETLEQALIEVDVERRTPAIEVKRLLDDVWTVEAWLTPGGSCPACFASLRHEPAVTRECSCAAPPLDRPALTAAIRRLVDWAHRRLAPGVAAWILESAQGGEALSEQDRLELARLYRKAGRNDLALRALSPADSEGSPPARSHASLHLRLTYEVAGPASALRQIRAWADRLGADPAWVRNAAQVLARHGDTAGARELLEQLLSNQPQDGPAHAILAQLLPPGRERDRHRQLAASGDPPDSTTVRDVAEGLARSGDRSRAIALVRAASSKLPEDRDLRVLVVDLSVGEPETWPSLEQELRTWLVSRPDDELLERLIDLYVRSERWSQLSSPRLPSAHRPETQALARLARVVATRDFKALEQVDQLAWERATMRTWVHTLVELASLMGRQPLGKDRLEQCFKRLPATFDSIKPELVAMLRGRAARD